MEILRQLDLTDLLRRALNEDIGHGDISTAATVAPGQPGRAKITAKEERLVFCGGSLIEPLFSMVGAEPKIEFLAPEGAELRRGQSAAEIEGLLAGMLIAERTALNFLQLLSGIATLTRQYVEAVAGTHARIIDTRKTHPGLRALEKYAVRVGGGFNHRFGLDGGVLIKDNHIAAAGSIAKAVEHARHLAPHTVKIQVECETLEQVGEALKAGVTVILLDNMPIETMRRAREMAGPAVQLEASGGITLETVHEIAETEVDLISVGALTHSVRAIDLSMRIESP
ncbi:MAG TPA: carboxylating nicotinate-nucleotide diphosphorylase [Candidatus Binataceae bacterium]|nr:carboxylating nicotinate-nucleotide diphosphorylase [Candidatus Binataceae bacterium]